MILSAADALMHADKVDDALLMALRRAAERCKKNIHEFLTKGTP